MGLGFTTPTDDVDKCVAHQQTTSYEKPGIAKGAESIPNCVCTKSFVLNHLRHIRTYKGSLADLAPTSALFVIPLHSSLQEAPLLTFGCFRAFV